MTILDKPAARKLYDRIAGRYDGWLLPFRLLGLDRWRRRLVNSLELAPGDVVIDLCCGTGESLGLLANAVGPGGRVVGVDLSEGMLEKARTKTSAENISNVELIRADVETFRIPRIASAVLSTFGLEMVPRYDDVIQRCAESLPPGSRFGLLGVKYPERWPEFLVRSLESLVKPFGATREYRAFQPWTSAASHMRQLSYEEHLAGAVYSSIAVTA